MTESLEFVLWRYQTKFVNFTQIKDEIMNFIRSKGRWINLMQDGNIISKEQVCGYDDEMVLSVSDNSEK